MPFYRLGIGVVSILCLWGCGSQPPQPKIDQNFKVDLAEILIQAKAYDEAMPIVQKMIKQYPKHAEIHRLLGVVLREKGVYEEAERVLQYAIKLNPKAAKTYTDLGILYSLINQHKKAISLHQKAIQLNDGQAQLYNNLGFSLYLYQHHKEAIKAYQTALRLAPQRKQIFINLALAYGALKQDQKAIRLLREALSPPELLNTLGVIKEQRGETSEALRLYKEAVAIGYLMSPSIASLNVKPKVINLLKVQSQQQVQIDVRFAEVNRLSLREIGASFTGGEGEVGSNLDPNANGFKSSYGRQGSDFGKFLFRKTDISFPFEATLNLFAERSLSRTLAEPTLVALSGEKATFLAGGEQPVPQVSGLGVPSIEYKKFGIQLDFTPTVLANQTIELNTQMSVSVLDNSQVLSIAGTDVPLFKTRASGTTIRLVNGQSFAIAGLLQDQMENIMTYLPGLADIPILGMLFNSRRFQRRETELVIVITARLVNPVNTSELPPLPGAVGASDPSDVHVFLLNGFEPVPPPSRRVSKPGTRVISNSIPVGRTPSGKIGFWR